MKSIITTIFLLVSVAVFSQFKATVTTVAGYENNINKSPDSYLSNKVLKTENDLYQSSFYQEGKLKLSYKEKWNNNRFRIYMNPEMRFYFTEQNANRLLLNTGINYLHSFSKKYKWESSFKYKLKDQKGEDLDEEELSTPLGHNTITFTTGLHTRLLKKNRTFIRASYDIKDFDKSDTRDASYNRYGLYLRTQNHYKIDGKRHKFGIRAGFYNRDYTLDYYLKNRIRYRTWQYYNAGVFYTLPLTNSFRVDTALDYEKRVDKTNNKYGYSQLKPYLGLRYKEDNFNAKLGLSYINRDFTTLQASSTEERNIEDLNYKNTKVTLNAVYKFSKNLHFLTDNYLYDRVTNNTRIKTKWYRSYNRYYSGVGVRYKF